MRELTPQSAVELVLDRGLCRASDRPQGTRLTGGVSSNVILVEAASAEQRWVLKQPCPRLKVSADWQCSVERIWREVEVLEICGKLLERRNDLADRDELRVPRIEFTDRENYIYAMTAAPVGSKPWKELLQGGALNLGTAEQCGLLLGQLHGNSWLDAGIAERLDDREFFEQLRMLPYYHHVFKRFGELHRDDLQEALAHLMESVWENRLSLVHGDFSPKNILVSPGQAMLIDFEVGHYGDPAFDLGFFLTHLVCKEVHYRRGGGTVHPSENGASPLQLANHFWTVYQQTISSCLRNGDGFWEPAFEKLELRAMKNLGGCLLARVDGKSPLDYIQTEDNRKVIRAIGERILLASAERWPTVYENLRQACQRLG